MKKLIFTLSVAAIAACASAQDGSWANYQRYADANAALTHAPDVVFMGNSITDGWDDKHPEFFADNNFACRGISGQVTGQMVCRFYSDVINLKPKAVVILAGINDFAQNQGPIDDIHVFENIMAMVDLAQQAGITPYVSSLIPCDTIPWNANIKNIAPRVVKFNDTLRKYAQSKGITYIDYYSALCTPDGALDSRYTTDGVHPTRAGYDIMEPIVLQALNSTVCRNDCANACCGKNNATCKKNVKNCDKMAKPCRNDKK